MMKAVGDRWSVIGVVSAGRGCGGEGNPGIYTRVTSYLGWIKQTVLDSYEGK